MTEKKREHHDAGDDGELGRLKIKRPEMEPAARAVNLRADEFRQNEKDDAGADTSAAPPADPAVIDQAREHESEETDGDPVRLFAPEFGRHRILAACKWRCRWRSTPKIASASMVTQQAASSGRASFRRNGVISDLIRKRVVSQRDRYFQYTRSTGGIRNRV